MIKIKHEHTTCTSCGAATTIVIEMDGDGDEGKEVKSGLCAECLKRVLAKVT